jgi:SAM-dependent methyltransferase
MQIPAILRGVGKKRGLFRAALRLARPLWRIRRLALLSELVFWDRWLARRRSDPELAERLRGERPLQASLWKYVEQAPSDPVRVLEVGAGPVGSLGSQHPRRRIELTPTDVLAPQYARLLRRHGLSPRIPTVWADMERLSEQFGRDAFDVVYAANCIDHTTDAPRAFKEMVTVLRPGGTLVMDHCEDEGTEQDYAGLHQWNLRADEGRLVLWNERERHDVAELLAGSCEVRAVSHDGQVHAEIRKQPARP